MANPPKLHDPQAQAAALSLAEKNLMFCVSNRTKWERAGITRKTLIALLVKGLIEHDDAGELSSPSRDTRCSQRCS
jgi:hypothetical protein